MLSVRIFTEGGLLSLHTGTPNQTNSVPGGLFDINLYSDTLIPPSFHITVCHPGGGGRRLKDKMILPIWERRNSDENILVGKIWDLYVDKSE